MKNKFISKSLIAKVALVLVIILLFEFTVSKPVHAASLGGTLLNPIVNLVVYLADGVISILQNTLLGMDQSFIYIDLTETGSFWKKFAIVAAAVVGVIALVGAGVACVASGGAVLAVVGPMLIKAGVGLAAAEITAAVLYNVVDGLKEVMFGNSFVYASIKISPESILKNEISFFDVDFFNNTSSGTKTTQSITQTLRVIISQVYNTVRDISLVAMLIVIIYIAIRMLLALTPKEKSRYKESAVNCIIGLVLIIVMHYIMSISVTLVNMITNSINSLDYVTIADGVDTSDKTAAADSVASQGTAIGEAFGIDSQTIYEELKDKDLPGVDTSTTNKTYIAASTFTEQARYRLQKIYDLEDGADEDDAVETWEHIGWAIVYIMLVVLTISFVWMYGKRVIYVAALIMLAPVVGVMYPINRANGSRAHTLNLWFKEFMGNLAIQPLHLFLYTILIGSAIELAVNNPVYVIIAIMGLLFIENLVKDLLGIQDTRMGNLGRALQDTTRAIKTTEKAATTIARTVGRTASKGVNTISGAITSKARGIGNDSSEESEGTNQTIHEQRNTPSSNTNGENNLPPPTAGAQTPIDLESGADNDDIKEQEKPKKKELDEVATMQKYMSEGGKQNANGEFYNPWTDEYDANYNPLQDKQFQAFKDADEISTRKLDEKATMQNYLNSGYGQNANGEYYNPSIDDYDANYNPLNDSSFRERGDTNIESRASSSSLLDNDTISAVNSLNGPRIPFTVVDGIEENVVRTDGDRNILRDESGNLRIEPVNTSDGRDPMAIAMAAGNEGSTTNFETITTPRNIESTDVQIENRGGSTSTVTTTTTSGTTSFDFSGGSQNIPDGNNSNPSRSSSRVREQYTVVDGGLDKNGNTKITNNTGNTQQVSTESANTRTISNNGTNVNSNKDVTIARENNGENKTEGSSQTGGTNTNSNNNVNNVGANSGENTTGNTGSSQSNGENTTGNTGSSQNNGENTTGNTGNSQNNGENTTGNTGNSQNDGTNTESNNNNGNIKDKIASGIQKADEIVQTAGGRAIEAAGIATEGVIDFALNAVSGNVGGTADAAFGTASGVVGAAIGQTIGGSSSSSSKTSSNPKPRTTRKSQNVEHIMKEAGVSEEQARVIEMACKRYKINDDRNMAEIAKVWKNTSPGEQPKIFELAQILIQLKADGKNTDDVEKVLNNTNLGSKTKDLLMKMYKYLHT